MYVCMYVFMCMGFPGSSVVKRICLQCRRPQFDSSVRKNHWRRVGYPVQYCWASLMAQLVKNPPAMWETCVWSLGQKNPLEKGMVIHSGILAWEIHGQRSLVGYSSWGEWLTHTHIHHYNIIGKSFTTLELLILQSVHPFLPLTQPLAITNLFTVSI